MLNGCNLKRWVLLSLLLTCMLSGCGVTLDVVKRYHQPGFYISLKKEHRTTKAEQRQTTDRKFTRVKKLRSKTVNVADVQAATVVHVVPKRINPKVESTIQVNNHRQKNVRAYKLETRQTHSPSTGDEPYIVPYFTLLFAIGGLVAVAGAYMFLGLSGLGIIALLVASTCLFLGSVSVLLFKMLQFDPLKTRSRSGGYWGQLLNVLIIAVCWLSVFRTLYQIGTWAFAVLDVFELLN